METRLLRLDSEWVGDSNMRVRVREVSNRRKLLIDIIELTATTTSKSKALEVARKYARLHSVINMDASMIKDVCFDRKGTRLDGSKVLTHIRATTWAFQGVI